MCGVYPMERAGPGVCSIEGNIDCIQCNSSN